MNNNTSLPNVGGAAETSHRALDALMICANGRCHDYINPAEAYPILQRGLTCQRCNQPMMPAPMVYQRCYGGKQ